jgi:hypothetical protein
MLIVIEPRLALHVDVCRLWRTRSGPRHRQRDEFACLRQCRLLPSRASCRQRCTTLSLMPWDIATWATDTPGSSHCASSSALNCAPYRRRVFLLSLVIPSIYFYVDAILPATAGNFKMTWPDAYHAAEPHGRMLPLTCGP